MGACLPSQFTCYILVGAVAEPEQRGGVDVDVLQCDVLSVDAGGMSWADFNVRGYRGNPVRLVNLDMSAELDWSQSGVLERFGDQRVEVSNGRNAEEKRQYTSMRLQDFLIGNTTMGSLFLSDSLTALQREVFQMVDLPPLFVDFSARPIMSIGLADSGEDFHSHDEAWLLLLQGVKVWWFAEADTPGIDDLEPCALLGQAPPQGVQHCVQRQGEAVYFGGQAHATCNVDGFALGVGAQGHTEAWPPVVRAAHRGDTVELAHHLGGESLAAVTSRGRTALHQAAAHGHLDVARQLLAARADIRASDTEGVEPEHLAALVGHLELLEHLLSVSGSQHLARSEHREAMDVLHYAAMRGHLQIVRHLIERGSDLTARVMPEGTVPLHFAAKGGHAEVVKFLLKDRATVKSSSGSVGTPLHLASAMGHVKVVKLLLKRKGDPHTLDERSLAPIHLAVRSGHLRVVQQLLGCTRLERLRPSLLHFAAEGGQVKVAQILVENGAADIRSLDDRGFQPLHVAALNGQVASVRYLLDGGAEVWAEDRSGFSPLLFASKGGHVSTIQILTERRADLHSAPSSGITAAEVARRMGHREVLDFIDARRRMLGWNSAAEL